MLPPAPQEWPSAERRVQAGDSTGAPGSIDIHNPPELRTAPRTVVQVFSSDNYDPWDPSARSSNGTSPREALRPPKTSAGQGLEYALNASKDTVKVTNKMRGKVGGDPWTSAGPPNLTTHWPVPGLTTSPAPGLAQSTIDPWGIDLWGHPEFPSRKPQMEWQSFLQTCKFCGKEIRTITQGKVVGQDCYQCGKFNTLTPKTLRGSNYAAHFNIDCELDARETAGVDTAPVSDEFPLKVLCMACQVSGTILVKENFIGTDCAWCGKRDTLAYLDPWTQDPRNDPQPLMPFGALTALSQPPAYIFRIQADLNDFRECTRCHRHLRQDYHKCGRCQFPQCSTHSCIFLHNQWCGGAFNMDEPSQRGKAQGRGDRSTGKWAWALWPTEATAPYPAQLAQAGLSQAWTSPATRASASSVGGAALQ